MALWCPGAAAQVAVGQHPHQPWLSLSMPLGRKYFGLSHTSGLEVGGRRAGQCWPSAVTHRLLLSWCAVLQYHCSLVITASVSRLKLISSPGNLFCPPLQERHFLQDALLWCWRKKKNTLLIPDVQYDGFLIERTSFFEHIYTYMYFHLFIFGVFF